MSVQDPHPQQDEYPGVRGGQDISGPDSFPASDPPSTWWGGEHDRPPADVEPSGPARASSVPTITNYGLAGPFFGSAACC